MLSWISHRISEYRPSLTVSVLVLVLANLVPLYGVLILEWPVFPLLLLFWAENVVIGVFNVVKLIMASPSQPLSWAAKVVMVPFFCFHYGMFTFVHGIFVFALFGGAFDSGGFPAWSALSRAITGFQLGWAILALFLSHAASFILNYVGKGEYRQATLSGLMMQPYGRVVLLHVTILAGGFVVAMLGSPAYAMVVLVVAKTIIDVRSHMAEHGKYRAGARPTGPQVLSQKVHFEQS